MAASAREMDTRAIRATQWSMYWVSLSQIYHITGRRIAHVHRNLGGSNSRDAEDTVDRLLSARRRMRRPDHVIAGCCAMICRDCKRPTITDPETQVSAQPSQGFHFLSTQSLQELAVSLVDVVALMPRVCWRWAFCIHTWAWNCLEGTAW